jgi:hypothetical protein
MFTLQLSTSRNNIPKYHTISISKMKLQLQTLAYLTLLSNPALAQLLSANTTQLIAWKSYGEIIRQLFTAAQPLEWESITCSSRHHPRLPSVVVAHTQKQFQTLTCTIAQTHCKSRGIPSSTFLAEAILTAWRRKKAQYQYSLTLLTWKYA